MDASRVTIVLARYKSSQLLKEQYRAAGRKITGVKASQLREEADQYLAQHHEEVMAWAQDAVTKLNIKDKKPKAQKSTTSTSHMLGAK